jgi:hypothetical protein
MPREKPDKLVARLVIPLILSVAGSSPLASQPEPASCADAARAVAGARIQNADVERLAECPVSGPSALAELWSRRNLAATADLSTVVTASRRIRDSRIYRSILSSAADAGRPSQTRLGMLQVLIAYYDGGFSPSFEYLTRSHLGDPIPVAMHAVGFAGSSPLPATRFVEVPRILAQLARQDPDSVVRAAALRLRQALALRDPANTPVAPGAVRLVAGCGPRVTLFSEENVLLTIRVRVLGDPYDQTFGMRGAAGGRASSLSLALPPGTVTASYGTRELARLAKRDAPCPPGVTKK